MAYLSLVHWMFFNCHYITWSQLVVTEVSRERGIERGREREKRREIED